MSDDTDAELKQAKEDIESATDVLDVLVVLLSICRRHASEVVAAGQDLDKRTHMRLEAARVEGEASAFTSKFLTPRTKGLVIKALEQATHLAVTARAWALGINVAMEKQPQAYSLMCEAYRLRRWGKGAHPLKEGDPYPTPSAQLSRMYGRLADGSGGFSRRPRRNPATSFDRLDGLALWGSTDSQPLRILYDTDAGAHLDHALVQRDTVNILAVVPNRELFSEFDFREITNNTFFNARPKKPDEQDGIIQRALQVAREQDVDIVVTPELSCTEDTVALIVKALSQYGGGPPRVVIAGGRHVEVNGKRWNRMSTIYAGSSPMVIVEHDKIAEYVFPMGKFKFEEKIDRSTELRIHAGSTWSMIPLICADLLDDAVVDAVADLSPRMVLVPSMSSKTGDFEMSMGAVIRKSQALVMVVNGPHEWPPEPKTSDAETSDAKTPGAQSSGNPAGSQPPTDTTVPVAVIGMPLATSWIKSLSPAATDTAPYAVLFRSGSRSADFIKL